MRLSGWGVAPGEAPFDRLRANGLISVMLSLSKRDSTGSYTQELWRQSPFSETATVASVTDSAD